MASAVRCRRALRVCADRETVGDLEQCARFGKVGIARERPGEQVAASRRFTLLERDAGKPQQRSGLRRVERQHTLERRASLAGLAQSHIERAGEQVADNIAWVSAQGGFDDLVRVLEASLVPETLGLPEHISARRPPPLAAEHVPDSRKDHDNTEALQDSRHDAFYTFVA